jgi:hypothetical protein
MTNKTVCAPHLIYSGDKAKAATFKGKALAFWSYLLAQPAIHSLGQFVGSKFIDGCMIIAYINNTHPQLISGQIEVFYPEITTEGSIPGGFIYYVGADLRFLASAKFLSPDVLETSTNVGNINWTDFKKQLISWNDNHRYATPTNTARVIYKDRIAFDFSAIITGFLAGAGYNKKVFIVFGMNTGTLKIYFINELDNSLISSSTIGTYEGLIQHVVLSPNCLKASFIAIPTGQTDLQTEIVELSINLTTHSFSVLSDVVQDVTCSAHSESGNAKQTFTLQTGRKTGNKTTLIKNPATFDPLGIQTIFASTEDYQRTFLDYNGIVKTELNYTQYAENNYTSQTGFLSGGIWYWGVDGTTVIGSNTPTEVTWLTSAQEADVIAGGGTLPIHVGAKQTGVISGNAIVSTNQYIISGSVFNLPPRDISADYFALVAVKDLDLRVGIFCYELFREDTLSATPYTRIKTHNLQLAVNTILYNTTSTDSGLTTDRFSDAYSFILSHGQYRLFDSSLFGADYGFSAVDRVKQRIIKAYPLTGFSGGAALMSAPIYLKNKGNVIYTNTITDLKGVI